MFRCRAISDRGNRGSSSTHPHHSSVKFPELWGISRAWLPQAFASITRSRVINHIAQVNDALALAAGTNWISVYDFSLHKWINQQNAIDDSSAELDSNLVLAANGARVRVLNGPFCNYTAGSGSWRCER